MSRDLLVGVREGVKGLVDLFLEDLVLYRHDGCQKDIVVRLGLDPDVQLLHTKGEATDERFVGTNDAVEAWLDQTGELAAPFNHADFGRADCEEAGNAHVVVVGRGGERGGGE